MAKTGAKFRTCNVVQAEAHNRRRKAYTEALKKKYGKAHYREDLAHLNMFWDNPDYHGMSVAQIKRQAAEEAKAKTGRKMQEKASPVREACPPIKPDTDIEDFDYFKRWLATKGIKVISIDLHHDEGHYDKDTNEWVPNHHAHIIVDWFNHETGKAVRLTPMDCKEMQTALAESLGMERGTPKEDTGIEGLSATEFKLKKAKEELKGVREDIEASKERLRDAKEELDDVKKEVSSMNIKKAAKQKILGLFNQSSKDEQIKDLKEDASKEKTDHEQKVSNLILQLQEEERQRRELEARIKQLEKDKKEVANKQLLHFNKTIFTPLLKEVWRTLNSMSNENLPEPEDVKSFYESILQRLKSTIDTTLPAMRKDSERAGADNYQRETIWPWITEMWNAINSIAGISMNLPKKLAEARDACSERLHQLLELTDQRVKDEKAKGLQEYLENTVEPKFKHYADAISQQKAVMVAKDKTIAEQNAKYNVMEKLLGTIGLTHPFIKDAYDAIYSLSTTSTAKRFSPAQASAVDKALSLASDPSQRGSIAQWLLDQVWKAVGKSSTYSAWYRNNAYPETMTIANGDAKKDGRGQRQSSHQRKL